MASGSEVELIFKAADELEAKGIDEGLEVSIIPAI